MSRSYPQKRIKRDQAIQTTIVGKKKLVKVADKLKRLWTNNETLKRIRTTKPVKKLGNGNKDTEK